MSYLDKLTVREQCKIIHTANIDEPYEKCPVQTPEAKIFFESLMDEKKRFPDVIFDFPELDRYDEESIARRKMILEGVDMSIFE